MGMFDGILGGVVGAESEVDRGTTFSISIPCGTAHLPQDRMRAARSLASISISADAYVEEALRWLPNEAAFGTIPVYRVQRRPDCVCGRGRLFSVFGRAARNQ